MECQQSFHFFENGWDKNIIKNRLKKKISEFTGSEKKK
jgi:hypothetical protein